MNLAIGIDNELIVTTGEDMVELNNGCICCTINNDLVEAVYKVLERQSKWIIWWWRQPALPIRLAL